tara:strand:- start:36 stop:551 length:516 start_codon:yes stop_codon:yes gene_type:complete
MNSKKVKVSMPINPVKAKAKIGGPNAVDNKVLERAEAAIEEMSEDYLVWVQKDLADINSAFESLLSEKGSEKENLERIFLVAHDMKGQGGTFGFDLITTIADQLCRLVDNKEFPNKNGFDAVRVHIDAMRVVLNKRIKGNGGREGEKVLNGLNRVMHKTLDEENSAPHTSD